MAEPMLRAWMQEYTPPAPHHQDWPGRWVAEPCWPPADAGKRRLYLRADGALASQAGRSEPRAHRGEQTAGLDAGALTADGGFGDWPGDQRGEDGRSLSFTSAPLTAPVEILGNPLVRVRVTSDRPGASIVARLCDVAPTGESLLVTRDLFNLAHRAGHDRAVPLVPGEAVTAEFPLKVIAHRFGTGHRIRLSVSTTYWPWMWPHPEPVTLGLACGPDSFVELPVREPREADSGLAPFGPPERPSGLAVEVLSRRPTRRTITHDLTHGSADVVFDWDVGGNFRLVDAGIEADGASLTSYRITAGQPLSAEVRTEQSASLRWPGHHAAVASTGHMTASATAFLVTLGLDAREDGHRVHSRQWCLEFPRNGT
jgi:hypothetical protein